MSKKIKVELTEKQYMAMAAALSCHLINIDEDEFIDRINATEIRVIENGLIAMTKGYEEWEMKR